MKRDRRDRGQPREKEWQEFRTGYAAARLFAFLLDELDEVAPEYVADLRQRLNYGIVVGQGYLEDDPDSDGPALIPRPSGEDTMMDLSAAELLEAQLFPEAEAHDPRDFQQITRGMVVVAFHSTLESYATALGATKGPLPKAVARLAGSAFPASLADELTEFHETRNLVVHHRGVVNDTYVNNVKYNKRVMGELRSLSAQDVERYAEMIWSVAGALRASGSANT
jgi:hypothetical protein